MKKLSLSDIKSGSLIKNIEKVTVTIKVDGEDAEFDTNIKPFSYATAVAQMKAYGEDKEALAGVLSSCLCDEQGVLLFTELEVRENFSQALVDALWEKIYEVNILGKNQKLTQTQNSSVKLESPQEEVLPKSKNSTSQKSKRGQPTETKGEA